MGRVVCMALLALVLPLAAVADSSNQVDFGNVGGTLTGSDAGLSLSGSTLTSVVNYDGLGTITGNNLGSLTLTTGALISGNLQSGGTFAGGGSFQIATNGSNGLPDGVIFTGSFSGNVSWQLFNLGNGVEEYTLSGPISGTLVEGNKNIAVVGVTIQLTVTVNSKGLVSIMLAGGNTNLAPVPEPGTLGLLGAGLLGIAALGRQKLKAR
jgi:hypothetical protein